MVSIPRIVGTTVAITIIAAIVAILSIPPMSNRRRRGGAPILERD